MHTSKAFRCTLPGGLRDDQVSNIRHWAYLHCAQSGIFRDHGVVVLVAVKDEFRTAASFGRTIRTALRRLCVDVPLRGHWCTLITPREALSINASGTASRGAIVTMLRRCVVVVESVCLSSPFHVIAIVR